MTLKFGPALALALAAFAAGSATQARADVWWTLKDVTLGDGTSVSGSFLAQTYYATGASVATQDGTAADGSTAIAGYTYVFGTIDGPNAVTFRDTTGTGTPNFYSHFLALAFVDPLGVAEAHNPIAWASSVECVRFSCSSTANVRSVASGYAAAPELPTWAMMIVGLGLLGFAGTRRVRSRLPVAG